MFKLTLSFGSSGRSPSFGSRGSAQRKEKKRKQEFHKHKVKFTEQQNLDFEQLKSRVMSSLEKLGHQTFSMEPGGYTFHNWMTSFNMLLDDFEERAVPTNLPKEYFDKRLELTADLLKPIDTSDLDQEIEKLTGEREELERRLLVAQTTSKLEGERRREEVSSKIASLKKERIHVQDELESERESLLQRKKESQKSSFFKRLLSKSSDPNSVESTQKRIKDLEARLTELDEEITKSVKEKELLLHETASEDSEKAREDLEKSESFQTRLDELGAKKLERLQLVEKRENITRMLSEVVSKISLGSQIEEKESKAGPLN